MPDTTKPSIVKEITGELPIKEAYQDLLHPAASAAGQTLALPFRAVNVLLTPISKWVIQGEAKLNEISQAVSEKVKDVPPEKLVEPEPYVAVPAMQAFSYSMDSDDLKELYANLLANAINADKKSQVHPAYVEIIKQMSPLDARALEYFTQKGRTAIPLCNIRWQRKSGPSWKGFEHFRHSTSGSFIYRHLSNAEEDGFTNSDITVSFENLHRLGLIEISDEYVVDREAYKPFDNHPLFEFYNFLFSDRHDAAEKEVALLTSSAQITALGTGFCSICLPDAFKK